LVTWEVVEIRARSDGGDPVDLDRVAVWVASARRVTVLTGAGISTDSGIPDYRGPSGV
jgi:NAD-dependent deacetylase